MSTLTEQLNAHNAADKARFDEAFAGMAIPADLRRVSERICRSYGINGLCDPAYIANVIAVELGRGNGRGEFTTRGATR